MSALRALALYRVVFSALLIVASVQTMMATHAEHGLLLLAGSEIAGALLLCWRRTQWIGAGVLLIVFACAQWLTALQGEWPTRFLQFATSALLIVVMDRALAGSHLTTAATRSVQQH
jgi:hypothetical protein